MKKLIFLFVLSSTIFIGCKRENDEITIKGRLLKSCNDNSPVANKSIQLFISKTSNQNNKTTTDDLGYFEIKYNKITLIGTNPLMIRTDQPIGNGFLTLAKGIPNNKDIDLGNLYYEQNYFAIIILDPKKDFSEKDTFFYDFLIKPRKFVVGPFKKNQVVDSIEYRHEIYFDKELATKYSDFNYFMYQTRLNNNKPYFGSTKTKNEIEPQCFKWQEIIIPLGDSLQ